jgi:hypothetical protein
MKNRIKFYLDEHIPKAIANGLRRRGIDVITVVEAGFLVQPMKNIWREQN